MDDVILAKAEIIERCIRRVSDEYAGDTANLTDNQTKQDSIILNIQRACEACIDLAMHLVRKGRLGIPEDSRQSFALLIKNQRLDPELGARLQNMVGFRNTAVHDYQAVNLDIVRAIIDEHLEDLRRFARGALQNHA